MKKLIVTLVTVLSIFTFVNASEARWYDPESGRFLSEDPIGFQGGVNFYVYVLNNPVNHTDPLGLDTYMCKKPLDLFGGTGTKSGPDVTGNPLYHQYICVVNEQGTKCVGQSSAGGKLYGEGAKSRDTFVSSGCEKVATNKCIEACILNTGSNRPTYGLVGPGTNCQEWATDTFNKCVSQCF